MNATRYFLVVAMAGLAGCIGKRPAYEDPLDPSIARDIEGSWYSSGARPGRLDHEWIKSFGDRRLNAYADEVVKSNFDLKIAASRVAQAAEDARIAGARIFPIVRAGLDGERRQQAFIGLPFANPNTGMRDTAGDGALSKSLFNNFGVSLNLDWELDLWGRIRKGQSAAIADTYASAAEHDGLETSLRAQTAKVWFTIQEADQQLDLARRALDSFKESERTISDGFELANLPASQLKLAMSQTASAEALVEERKGQKKLAIRQLQILLGKYPSGNIDAPGKFAKLPKPPPAGLPSELLRRRADVIAAERRVAAAAARIEEAKRAAWPQIKLTSSGGTATESLTNVLNPDNAIWALAGGVTQTIMAGGEIRANESKREAIYDETVANYQRVALNAFTEVENALTLEDLLRRREAALTRSENFLLGAYTRSMDEYKDGVGDILTILTAQKNLLEAKGLVISIQRMRLQNRVDLHLALGGDFDATDPAAWEEAEAELKDEQRAKSGKRRKKKE